MKPSNIRQIISEDYKTEDRDTISRLGGVLNYFMRQIIEILSGNVDLDNMTWELLEVDVTVDADGTPNQVTRFNSSIINPRGIFVVNATNISSYPTSQPFISFTPQGGGIITVNNVSGLQADTKYKLKFIVI